MGCWVGGKGVAYGWSVVSVDFQVKEEDLGV